MKIYFLCFFFHLSTCFCFSQANLFPIIPQPDHITPLKGFFIFSSKTQFIHSEKNRAKDDIFYKELIRKNCGIKFSDDTAGGSQKNCLYIKTEALNSYIPGAYHLEVRPDRIYIRGDTIGIFYAFQTLLQLINGGEGEIKIPCLMIEDKPCYQWRGMHLDVCRHFFTKEEVKKYIDYLALYKFNIFHWHLTEDQGWRIEIKKYPLLTQIGSKRKETVIGKQSDTAKYDDKLYEGFYTQNDIKEIVAYASERQITILPEIEMPGHALAALSAYPRFSCTGGSFQTATCWGVFDDVYCPKEETFRFLEDILTEVCELFPGKYIHIGGDECPKKRWKECKNCQALMKKESLKNENELQSYFIRRIEKFLNSKGKQIIGWDEILEGGLAPNAAVMSWRGTEGGIAAAKQKHVVVMSPGKPCYFDHYQSKNKSKEPLAIGGYNPLENVYSYNPMPAQVPAGDKQFVLGAQGNVWTEYIPTFKQVEYMSLPRMCALSEALWSKPSNKNYDLFIQRLKIHSKLLDKMNVNYAKHFLLYNRSSAAIQK